MDSVGFHKCVDSLRRFRYTERTAGQISLNELERRLDPACFRRVHRGHIVNLDHVSAIRPYDERRLSVRFADGSEVVASRAGSQLLREMVR